MISPEIRKDPVLNRWVLISGPGTSAGRAAACELCVLFDAFDASEPAKRAGVIVPKAPVLDRRLVVDRSRSAGELYVTMSGAGEHELIIETREHGVMLAELPVDHLQEILILYRERLLFLRQDNRFRYMTITKSPDARGHAFSEAFALPMVPPAIKEKISGLQGYNRRTGNCVYCDTIKTERAEKTRKIAESMRHLALAPFASRSPFEMILLPKGHHADYAVSSDQDLADLAALYSECLRRFDRVHPGVPVATTLETAPPEMGSDLQLFHWHFELRPLLGARAPLNGVLDVNPTPPEEAARLLREALL